MKFESLNAIESLAIVGATSLVGEECLEILAEHRVKIPRIKLISPTVVPDSDLYDVAEDDRLIETLTERSFEGVEVVFFAAPPEIARKYVPIAIESGALVIDQSSIYRMHPEVPLVVPEINGSILRDFQSRVISSPNCATTPIALALKPLLDNFGLERVVISTYQSVSGAGKAAYEELSLQAISLLSGGSAEISAFPHRVAFNCLPQIGNTLESGNSEEEEGLGRELQKILETPDLRVSATAVRVPTFCGHGAAVNVELRDRFTSIEEVRELLNSAPGLKVLDQPANHIYPTNVEAIGSDDTFIGRLRKDTSVDSGLNFWVITDNLRKGSALNVLQSLHTLYNYRRMS